MSEGGSKPSGSKPVWGKSRLGQSALLVELIGHVQGVRQAQTLSSVGFTLHIFRHITKIRVHLLASKPITCSSRQILRHARGEDRNFFGG